MIDKKVDKEVQKTYNKFIPQIPSATIVYNLLESPSRLLGTFFTFGEAYDAMHDHARFWRSLRPNKSQIKCRFYQEWNPDGNVEITYDNHGYVYPTISPFEKDFIYKDTFNKYHFNHYKIIPMSLTAKVGSSFVTYQEYDKAFEEISNTLKKDLINDF